MKSRTVASACLPAGRTRTRIGGHSTTSVPSNWDQYNAERKKQEDEIAKDFDVQRRAAMDQFNRGDYRWLAKLKATIADLGTPEEEVEELRTRTRARLAEAEAALRIE